jgi:hypothetical protein
MTHPHPKRRKKNFEITQVQMSKTYDIQQQKNVSLLNFLGYNSTLHEVL